MRIAVLGSGAIGSLIGSLFLKAQHEVIFIGSSNRVSNINRYGINIKSNYYGNFKLRVNTSKILNENFDIIFITLKGNVLSNVLNNITTDIKKKSLFISLMNGMGHYESLYSALIQNFSIGSIGNIEAYIRKDNYVYHSSVFKPKIELCLKDINQINQLSNLFIKSNIDFQIYDNEKTVIWNKLIRLGPVSILTSISKSSIGIIKINNRYNSILKKLIKEYCMIAASENYFVTEHNVIDQINGLPENLTTSLQRDIQENKNSEIENIIGIPLRHGLIKGLKLPIMKKCYEFLTDKKKVNSNYFIK